MRGFNKALILLKENLLQYSQRENASSGHEVYIRPPIYGLMQLVFSITEFKIRVDLENLVPDKADRFAEYQSQNRENFLI